MEIVFGVLAYALFVHFVYKTFNYYREFQVLLCEINKELKLIRQYSNHKEREEKMEREDPNTLP